MRVMDIVLLKACEKEIKKFPQPIKEDILDAIAKLRIGLSLSMPLSRSMPSIGTNVHELRLKDRSGQFRVIYYIKIKDAIYLVHGFRKTSNKTPKANIETALKRIRELK